MTDESLNEIYPDAVDVTNRVEHYEKGKTFDCDCDQRFGVPYGEEMWRCPTCLELIIDTKAGDREPPSKNDSSDNNKKDQSNLEAFF